MTALRGRRDAPDVPPDPYAARKSAHLALALDDRFQAAGRSGADRVQLVHDSLPELDLDDVDLTARRLGGTAPVPFFVAGMTAGHADAPALNARFAAACARRGWAFGVGSQRRELLGEQGAGPATDQWPELRAAHPDLTLIGNIGASQLVGSTTQQVAGLVDRLGADAMAVHLNPLQEALQVEGTPRFRGVLSALRDLVAALPVPVVVKETGCGLGAAALRKLAGTGVAAVDVSGLGGTHWGRIEGERAGAAGDAVRARAADTFAVWGQSTVDSLLSARELLPGTELWASGGVRHGLDAARLVALGADGVGYAHRALVASMAGDAALDEWMALQEFELRVAMFCTGAARLADLRAPHRVVLADR